MPRILKVVLKRYFKRLFQKDLMAGLTVGVISLPLAMAFAIASGVKPEYGIYSTIIAASLVAIFGGSRYQVAGPTGAFIPILLSIVLTYGYENLLLAGLLAGVILVVMGLLKFGSLIKFIPRPVTIGFTAGIAVNIFIGQIPNFLGLSGLERHEGFIDSMREIYIHLGTINPYSALTAVLCLAIILITPRFLPKLPGSLAGIIITTIVMVLFYPNEISTINSAFNGIPDKLPQLRFPDFSLDMIKQLLRPAFTIAMLGAIESLLSAVVADGMAGTQHNSNRELVGQGIANMVAPLFGGIPVTGAIARTATNIKSGAATRVSVIISSLFVLVTLLIIAPYAGHIPLASLAPVLMIVAFNMSERRAFVSILKTWSYSAVVLVTTFMLTVLLDLTVAVEVGLLLAMVLFVKRMSDIMVVTQVLPNEDANLIEVSAQSLMDTHDCPQISIYSVEGPLFFGAAQMFSQSVLDAIRYYPKFIILRMSKVPLIDLTGENHLRNTVEIIQKRGSIVLVAGLNLQCEKELKSTGLYDKIGAPYFFPHTSDAIAYATQQVDKKKCRECRKFIFKPCLSESNSQTGLQKDYD